MWRADVGRQPRLPGVCDRLAHPLPLARAGRRRRRRAGRALLLRAADRPPPPTPVDPGRGALMLATLVGLVMLLALVGGSATLAAVLIGRRLRTRHARRHPQQAAVRER